MSTLTGSKLRDMSGNGNDGTPVGGIVIGDTGNGTNFDGVNDYINISHNISLSIPTSVTVFAKVNTNTITTQSTVVYK